MAIFRSRFETQTIIGSQTYFLRHDYHSVAPSSLNKEISDVVDRARENPGKKFEVSSYREPVF